MSSAFQATQTSHTQDVQCSVTTAAGQNLSTNHSEHVVAGAAFKALIDVCSPGAVDIVADHVIALWGMISRVRCVQAATNECSAGEIRPHTFQSCQL